MKNLKLKSTMTRIKIRWVQLQNENSKGKTQNLKVC